MTEHDAILRAVLAHPDDDTPRLVYADWLDEHCQPDRAEFCRVQVELAQADEWGCGVRSPDGIAGGVIIGCPDCELRARERELWGAYPQTDDLRSHFHAQLPLVAGEGWCILPASMAADLAGHSGPQAVVCRGFVARITLPAAAFTADLARAVWACQPVTEVTLSDLEPTDEGEGWAFPDVTSMPEPVQYVVDRLHRTRDEAIQLLSAAAVAWGRALVGLPPGRG